MNYLDIIVESIFKHSSTVELLDVYITENMNDIYQLDNYCYDDSVEIKQKVDCYVKRYHSTIERLDYTKKTNAIFVLILIGYCERFGLISSFQYLFRILKAENISLPLRIQSASIYLFDISSNEQYIRCLDDICGLIQNAINEEYEDFRIIVCSFLNYLYYVIRNIPHYRIKLIGRVIQLRDNGAYDFLLESIIDEIITLAEESRCLEIKNRIDSYMKKCSYRTEGYTRFVIEKNTDYAVYVERNKPNNFQDIRQISLVKAKGTDVPNSRGCNPIMKENDLFLYIRSYGNMHYAKICEALNVLPENLLMDNVVEIISWGCGQGIEVIALMEKINIENIERVTLIEPSDLAIKRASLHVYSLGINDTSKISTVCKYVNDITSVDLISTATTTKIHLFSNILDISSVSITYLKELITEKFKGLNYFICVSPYERLEKAERLEQFSQNFINYKNFSLLRNLISTKDPDTYWQCNHYFKNRYCCPNHPHRCNGKEQWSCIIKVFSVCI